MHECGGNDQFLFIIRSVTQTGDSSIDVNSDFKNGTNNANEADKLNKQG